MSINYNIEQVIKKLSNRGLILKGGDNQLVWQGIINQEVTIKMLKK